MRKDLSIAMSMLFATVSASALARDAINTNLPAETPINPLVILADSNLGQCQRSEPGKKARTLGGPLYDRCRQFPLILAKQLEERGFDVKLEVFDPEHSISSSDYFNQVKVWRDKQAKLYRDRYLLNFKGLFEDSSSSIVLLSVDSPGEAREAVGMIELDKRFWLKKSTTSFGGGFTPSGSITTIARRDLKDVVSIVANTLEARCPTAGFLKNCEDRVTLVEYQK